MPNSIRTIPEYCTETTIPMGRARSTAHYILVMAHRRTSITKERYTRTPGTSPQSPADENHSPTPCRYTSAIDSGFGEPARHLASKGIHMINRSSALGIRVRTLFEQAGRSDLLSHAYATANTFDEAKALLDNSKTTTRTSASTLLNDAMRAVTGKRNQ